MDEAVTYRVGRVSSEKIWRIWLIVEPLVQAALDEGLGELRTEHVRNLLLSDQMQLFIVGTDNGDVKAACVTEVIQHPEVKSLRVVSLGGEAMDKWLDRLIEDVTAFGRQHGCKYIEGAMRKGWGKVLGRRGWKQPYVVMAKELHDVQ